MLHVVEPGRTPAPEGVLGMMFAARKAVFVDLLKWDVPVLDDAYENMLETCADAFSCKQPGHARRPPGRTCRFWRSRRGSHASTPSSMARRQTRTPYEFGNPVTTGTSGGCAGPEQKPSGENRPRTTDGAGLAR